MYIELISVLEETRGSIHLLNLECLPSMQKALLRFPAPSLTPSIHTHQPIHLSIYPQKTTNTTFHRTFFGPFLSVCKHKLLPLVPKKVPHIETQRVSVYL